ncbi:MAG TPA: GNAT family N-acetyltransferase [Allocoleopsis sp.]
MPTNSDVPTNSDRSAPFDGSASSNEPILLTDRLLLRLGTQADVAQIIAYYQDNRSHLAPFEPERPPEFYTHPFWEAQVENNWIEFHQDRSLRLLICKRTHPEQMIGSVNLGAIIRGAFQSCFLGYNLAEQEQGQGYMQEAVQAAIDHAFQQLNLHRIGANYMPHNQRSAKLLKKLGFVVEGYARDYLLIQGCWQDHILTSLLNPQWQPHPSFSSTD